MDNRTKTLFSFFSLAVALTTAGCGYTQQSKFQLSFLPPAPKGTVATVDLEPPPELESNLYLRNVPKEIPEILAVNTVAAERRSRAYALAQRADQSFQRGKRYYQADDIANARREFNSAIDLMLEASDQNPIDRLEHERRMSDMVDAIHRFDISGLGASATFEPGRFEKAPLEDILQMTFPVDPRLKDKVREQVAATVSQLPLSVTDAVLGYIHYFSNRGHRTLLSAYQRSGRYRPMIQRILDEEGVPRELIHLAQAESGFIPRAMSRAAAGGMWQFLTWRGQQYGLMQTRYTDDRMDPEKATRAAAKHLHDLYTEFGDWYLAVAAYNCGPVAVEKAVERTGYADFWELRNRGVLPAETTNYVPIILAMTIMEKNASEYGIEGMSLDPPLEYDTVEISAPTSLSLVADITEMPFSEIATLNPAVLRDQVPASFSLHVPKGAGSPLLAALEQIPAEHRNAWRMHRVGPGESLATIGKRYGATPASIAAANSLVSVEAVEGDRLLIPAGLRAQPAEKKNVARTSTRRGTRVNRASTRNSTRPTRTRPAVATKPDRSNRVILADSASQ